MVGFAPNHSRRDAMSDRGSSAGSVLVAFALGALAGAAVALLYAPASGEDTRRKLAEKAREGRERAEALAREGREFIERQRETLGQAVDRGREAFQQARKETM
jgi:gas vesicle protein